MNGEQYAALAHDQFDQSERTASEYGAEQLTLTGRGQVCALLAVYSVLAEIRDCMQSIDDALRNTVGGRS